MGACVRDPLISVSWLLVPRLCTVVAHYYVVDPPVLYSLPGGYCNFIAWSRAETNLYTRMLNGAPFGPNVLGRRCSLDLVDGAGARASDSARLLERAQHVVRNRFALVLTLDKLAARPDVAACALRAVLGWNRTALPRVNAGRARGRHARCDRGRAPLGGEERAAVARANAADAALYEAAVATEARILARLGCA